MTQFLLLDVIAIAAGLIALYFVLQTEKRFGKIIRPAFRILVTIIGLLMAAITVKYFIAGKEILNALNSAVIIAIPIAILIGIYSVKKSLPKLKA